MASWFGLCGNITIGDSMFCVVWVSGDDNAIYAQFLDASPALMGDYFQISDNIADHNATPAWIDYNLCNRHFVAVWADDRSVDYQLYGRVFNSERSDWSATLSLNDSLYINNYAIWFPKVFWNSDTSFTVFYRIEDGNLYRQSYNMQGNALGVVRRVNKLIDSAGDFSVARDSLGRMVAVWEDLTTDKILCQRFNSDASLLDSIFAVSSGTYQIPLLSLSTDFKDGRVCVVWNDADYRIWLQVFDFENPNKMTPEKSPTAPQDFLLAGNYPNPFNATTRIRFYLPQVGTVGIKVWDCRGHLVREKDFPAFRSGWNEIEFKADDLPSGIYLYEIKSGKNACQAKMLLMK
ncbi:MAG: T9SS type A sorting domain-containing protein [Candidatus Neomarinimicrobiota bacterium]